MPRRENRGYVWVTRVRASKYSIKVDGVTITADVIQSSWTRAIIGQESPCSLTLIDSDGVYAEKYVGGETIELLYDFADGTTSQWKGKLEKPKKKFTDAYMLELVGSHHQSELLDITVTEKFDGTLSASAIYSQLLTTYLSTHTSNNVASSTNFPVVSWDNKPLWDCIVDLCNFADFDAYVDSDKDHHFFARGSITNSTDAIVWQDTLLDIISFGKDSVDIKNRIIVYGEDNSGLPVVYRTDDTISQTANGVKEEIIKDSSIKTYNAAKELGDATLTAHKNSSEKGEFSCLTLPSLNPGEFVWITNPIQKIQGEFRVTKFTYFLPVEQMKVIIGKEETIPQAFKERKLAEQQGKKITNPFKMTNSYNFSFDTLDQIDTNLSSNVIISNSSLKVSSGSTGTMISQLVNTTSDVTFVQFKVSGDFLSSVTYHFSTNNGDTYQQINLEEKTSVTAGSAIRVKIELNNASTLIANFVALYR